MTIVGVQDDYELGYYLDESGLQVEIPEDKLIWIKDIEDEYERVQLYLESVYMPVYNEKFKEQIKEQRKLERQKEKEERIVSAQKERESVKSAIRMKRIAELENKKSLDAAWERNLKRRKV
jgi:hypothetical protein